MYSNESLHQIANNYTTTCLEAERHRVHGVVYHFQKERDKKIFDLSGPKLMG